jgi:pyridoxine 5-phosphate synthase
MPILVVNVDHVATLRQQRRGIEPDPVAAAALCELAGAGGIIVHLREDRRHIQDRDLELLSQTLKTPLHLEMAATEEMLAIALRTLPDMVCLVPEKREELTTEGGLDCLGREQQLADYLAPIHEVGVESSLFIDADPRQIDAAKEIGAAYVEIHTGHYADARTRDERARELSKILTGIEHAQRVGLKVNLGHGLNYTNVQSFAHTPGIREYSIGHSIISRAVLMGLDRAVRDMVELIRGFAE